MTTENAPVTLAQLEERMTELRDGPLSQGPAADGFDAAVMEYSSLIASTKNARVQANETAISVARGQLGAGIQALVDSLALADLKQEPITRVVWTVSDERTSDDGTVTPASVTVAINASATNVRRTSGPRKPRADGEASSGRDLAPIFEAHANEKDLADMAALDIQYESSKNDGGLVEGDDDFLTAKVYGAKKWSLRNRVANRVEKDNA